MSKKWFDPHNSDHCRAYRHLRKTGFWPEGFELHDVAADGALWQMLLMEKMTTAWIDRMLEKAETMDEKQDRIIRYKDKLADWNNDHNPDVGYADDILCELLGVLGCGEVVDLYCELRGEYNE